MARPSSPRASLAVAGVLGVGLGPLACAAPPVTPVGELDRYQAVRPAAASADYALAPAAAGFADRVAAEDPTATLVVDAVEGGIVHATGQLSRPSSDPAEVVARRFVLASGPFALRAPESDLVLDKAPVHYLGLTHLRLRQTWAGIPIGRRSVKVAVDEAGRVAAVSGRVADDFAAMPPPTPTVAQSEAADRIAAGLAADAPEARREHALDPELGYLLDDAGRGWLVWRQPLLVSVPVARGRALRAWLVTLDAHSGAWLGRADTTRSCADGAAGTVVTSAEVVRASLTGDVPVARPIETCRSTIFGAYFLEDHRHQSELFCYDGSGFADPARAGAWYSACVAPACATVSQSTNRWSAGDAATRASDYRAASKVLAFFRDRFDREGADGGGENLIVVSGQPEDNAWSLGIFRSMVFGAPDYAHGKPSYGGLDVAAHEFTHIVNWHEWVGVWDYGLDGSTRGVEAAVDEHLADLFGVLAQHRAADEPWLRRARWAHAAERRYAANYPHRDEAAFYRTMQINRNVYLGTYAGKPRAHVSQLYTAPEDEGGAHVNSVLLSRAAFLAAEGGAVDRAPDGEAIPGWPPGGPTYTVAGIGMDKLEQIFYHAVVTGAFATTAGTIGLGDVTQAEQDAAAMKAELTKFALVILASCQSLQSREGWPAATCGSVRDAYAGVGLLETDRKTDEGGEADDAIGPAGATGSGCRAAGTTPGGRPPPLLLLALAAISARRRRRSA